MGPNLPAEAHYRFPSRLSDLVDALTSRTWLQSPRPANDFQHIQEVVGHYVRLNLVASGPLSAEQQDDGRAAVDNSDSEEEDEDEHIII